MVKRYRGNTVNYPVQALGLELDIAARDHCIKAVEDGNEVTVGFTLLRNISDVNKYFRHLNKVS